MAHDTTERFYYLVSVKPAMGGTPQLEGYPPFWGVAFRAIWPISTEGLLKIDVPEFTTGSSGSSGSTGS